MAYEAFYIDEFQDYLEDLCVKNKEILHTAATEVAPAGQRTFSRFESEEHINAITNCQGKNIVVVADYFGQRIGEVEGYQMRNTVSIYFAVKRESGSNDNTDEINSAIKKAEEIMFQFIKRLEKDFDEGCNALEFLEPERMSWTKIENQPWLDNYYGWDLSLSFKSYMPDFDPDDWEE
jgi:hypothetical protein